MWIFLRCVGTTQSWDRTSVLDDLRVVRLCLRAMQENSTLPMASASVAPSSLRQRPEYRATISTLFTDPNWRNMQTACDKEWLVVASRGARSALLLAVLAGCGGDSAPSPGGGTSDAAVSDAGPAADASVDAGACSLPAELPDGPSNSAPWRLATIDVARAPTAVCNDGTPATFAIRRNPSSKRWMIWLEGGGECHDGASCDQRWSAASGAELMSSTTIRARATAGTLGFPSSGVFANDPKENPAFHDANVVEIQYCSSDLWSGDRAGNSSLPVGDVGKWNFRGRAIAFAALTEMLATQGLADATEVTLGGGSAGAAGIFNIVDEMRAQLPATARVIAIADGGFQIGYPAYDATTKKESTSPVNPVEAIALAGYQNWGGGGDASCTAAAADQTARVFCRSSENLLLNGHIATPIMVINNQYDINQVSRLGIDLNRNSGKVADSFQAAFAKRFAARMRAQLELVGARHAIFANYDGLHVTSQSDRAQTTEIGGVALRDAIAEWHKTPCAPVRRIEAEIAGQPGF